MICVRIGSEYDGTVDSKYGQHVLIKSGSVEEELITKWIESHVRFRLTTILINGNRREEGKEKIGVSAVINKCYQLQQKVTRIEKVQSGGYTQNWIESSYNITEQMKIILGEITLDEMMTNREGMARQ